MKLLGGIVLILALVCIIVRASPSRSDFVRVDDTIEIDLTSGNPQCVTFQGDSYFHFNLLWNVVTMNFTTPKALDIHLEQSPIFGIPSPFDQYDESPSFLDGIRNTLANLFSSNGFYEVHLSPIGETRVHVSSPHRIRVPLEVTSQLSKPRLALFVVGVLLVLFGSALAGALAFHLASGAAIGILASLILLAVIVGRRIHGRATIVAALGVTTVWTWALSFGRDILLRPWFIGYAIIGAVIGMAWVYKRPYDKKDQTILSLTLRATGFLCLFFSTLVWEYALALPVLTTLGLLFYRFVSRYVPAVYRRIHRPYKKMLTEAEYRKACDETTERELRKLREHLQETTSWMSRVQPDTINRVQEFLDTDSHTKLFANLDASTLSRDLRTPPRTPYDPQDDEESLSDGEGPDRLYPISPYVPATPRTPRTPRSPHRLDGRMQFQSFGS